MVQLFLMILIPFIVLAQTDIIPNRTQRIHAHLERLRDELKDREVVKRSDLLVKADMKDAFMQAEETYRSRRAENRRQCRLDVRRANRSDRQNTVFRCYRSQLTLDLAYLRKQRAFSDSFPGSTQRYATPAIEALDALTDALKAIISAIDTGVYETMEDAMEAKNALHSRYRIPYHHALNRLRADRRLSFIALLFQHLSILISKEALPEDIALNIGESVLCLQIQTSLLGGILATDDYQKSKNIFRQSQNHLGKCIETMRALGLPTNGSASHSPSG